VDVPSRQKPSQSQRGNARAKAKWALLWRYFADFEQIFAQWDHWFAFSM